MAAHQPRPWSASTLSALRDRRGPKETDPLVGLSLRLLIEVVVFGVLVVLAISTVDHAVRHTEYLRRYSNGDYYRSGTPTYWDALAAVLLGPGLQSAVFGGALALCRARGRTLAVALSTASWWLLALDVVVLFVLYTAGHSAL